MSPQRFEEPLELIGDVLGLPPHGLGTGQIALACEAGDGAHVTTGASPWSRRAEPPTSGASPIPRRLTARGQGPAPVGCASLTHPTNHRL